MATLRVSNEVIGPIRPVNGVDCAPVSSRGNFSLLPLLKKANIPFSRTHDMGLIGGNVFVDIPFLFRDFDADETKEENYDFTFTDLLISKLEENGVEPFYRLGVSIENFAAVKTYYIHPPKDFDKWARICEHIIRHYTEGWANGFHYNIRYWEIWNEPENGFSNEHGYRFNEMWSGTREEFYRLYEVASKHLKKCFPHLKIGGYASCGFYRVTRQKPDAHYDYMIEFFEGFLEHVKSNQCPLDFFSWHSYGSVAEVVEMSRYCRKKLDDFGFSDVETSFNEWNCEYRQQRGTVFHTVNVAAMLLALQSRTTEATAMFYDGRIGLSNYSALFNPLDFTPLLEYSAFVEFGEMYRMGKELKIEGEELPAGLYMTAATDGTKKKLMVANIGTEKAPFSLILPEGSAVTECRILDNYGKRFIPAPVPTILNPLTLLCIDFA